MGFYIFDWMLGTIVLSYNKIGWTVKLLCLGFHGTVHSVHGTIRGWTVEFNMFDWILEFHGTVHPVHGTIR